MYWTIRCLGRPRMHTIYPRLWREGDVFMMKDVRYGSYSTTEFEVHSAHFDSS